VEGKAAVWMRENNSSGGVLYHNHPGGTCGYCNSQIETPLPENARLRVVSPEGATPQNSRARRWLCWERRNTRKPLQSEKNCRQESTMRIEDFETIYQATETKEIEAILSKRYDDGLNGFWLSHGSERYPLIILVVKRDLANLHYFPKEDHPGFASVGHMESLNSDDSTEFFLHPDQTVGIWNQAIIPFSDALKAAKEFSVSPTLPKSIPWDEL
jgi:hypothetical protein